MRTIVHVLIPAAGASSRMGGRDKLLEPVGGEALLRRQARIAAAAGPVTVTLPPGAAARGAALEGLALRMVEVADAAEGMAASLRAGVSAAAAVAGPHDGLMVLPADMPDFTEAALAGLAGAFAAAPGRILRATAADGTPGNPVIFPRALWPELARVTGDRGGREVLARHRDLLTEHPLPGRMALTDLDTPADWAAWRASGGE